MYNSQLLVIFYLTIAHNKMIVLYTNNSIQGYLKYYCISACDHANRSHIREKTANMNSTRYKLNDRSAI